MPKSTDYAARLPDGSGHIAYDAAEDSVWHDLMARQLPSVQQRMAGPISPVWHSCACPPTAWRNAPKSRKPWVPLLAGGFNRWRP